MHLVAEKVKRTAKRREKERKRREKQRSFDLKRSGVEKVAIFPHLTMLIQYFRHYILPHALIICNAIPSFPSNIYIFFLTKI